MWAHFEEFKPLQLKNVAETGKPCGHVDAERSRQEINDEALAHLKRMGTPGFGVSENARTPADVPKLPISTDSKVVHPSDSLGLLTGPQTRAALSLLGLAFGDCAGLPFELTNGIVPSSTPAGMGPARTIHQETKGAASRQRLILQLVA